MENKYDISVVLAVYNEEGCIREEFEIVKKALAASKYSYEIIAVNDCSTDNSGEILESIEGIKVIHHRKNQGSGGSRKTGTLAARGKYVVWSDVDMTYPNDLIPDLVSYLEEHDYDQVVGARDKEMGTRRFVRVPAKWLIRRLAIFLSETDIPDLNSGLRAFKRDIAYNYLYLLPKGFSCVTTMTLSFLMNEHSVGYFNIKYNKRAGSSKFHPLKDTYRYVMQVIRMVMYFNPLKVFMSLSFLIFGISIFSSIINLVRTHSLQQIDIMLFMLVLNCLFIGFLADLIITLNKKR